MAEEKRGLFGFIKGITRTSSYTEEEKQQRSYALAKAKEEEVVVSEPEPTIIETPEFAWESDELAKFCKEKLEEILELSGFGGTVKVCSKNEKAIELEIIDSSDVGRIIGKEGATLESLQIIMRAFIFKSFDQPVKVSVDAGGYRRKRRESLVSTAKQAGRDALMKNTKIDLKPMNASDRREVHLTLEEDERVHTFSVGEGRYRHVVVEKRRDGSSLS
jgi:predicted RNA-binding protein Jag